MPNGEMEAADSAKTVASLARLEALASVEKIGEVVPFNSAEASLGPLNDGIRLAYSSVLIRQTREEAQALLAKIFTEALTKNPRRKIGGCMFYDEATSAIVQVLEGPSETVRPLYEKIQADPRHNTIKLLWERPATARLFEGFGMRLGNDPTVVLNGLESRSEEKDLLQLTYLSQLVAPSVPAAYQHIQDILAVAIVKNPTMKIGGSLFFNPRTLQVLQALEGPQSAVQALYDKIAEDARHTSCTVISKLSVPTRTYDQWGMLQGDLADWSSLAAGKMSMSNIYARRRGRQAREDMEEAGDSVAKMAIGDGPAKSPEIKAALVSVGGDGAASQVVVPTTAASSS